MHVYTSYPLGTAEAHSRWYSYPPPYWYNSSWYYATPWLWIDGNKDGAYFYSTTWTPMVTSRISVPSPVTATMWGDYNPGTLSGNIYAQFRNDSTAALTGRVLFVITEDSIYQYAPNGDYWHNNVARDYIPNVTGDLVTVPPGDSLTVSKPFTLGSTWNTDKIRFVAFIQDTFMQPDTIKEIWQGAMIDLAELGIEEFKDPVIAKAAVTAMPNPCTDGTRFAFTLTAGEAYEINIFDVAGRQVKTIHGIASGSEENIAWNLRDETGIRVSSGIYFYRFTGRQINTTGKVVVR